MTKDQKIKKMRKRLQELTKKMGPTRELDIGDYLEYTTIILILEQQNKQTHGPST